MSPTRLCLLSLLSLAELPACKPPRPVAAIPTASEVSSNVRFVDYAGSDKCTKCHPAIAADFFKSPMHNMTRRIAAAEIQAPFAGEEFSFKDDRARFEKIDGQRYLRLDSRSRGAELYRIVRVIGGHHREDFTGIQVRPDAPGGATLPGSFERVMPVNFALGPRAWRYKGYSVMSPERPELRAGAVWSRTCIFCHNTVPLLSTLLGTLADPAAGVFQGEVVDTLLPAERRASFEVTDAQALAQAISGEIDRLGAELPANTPRLTDKALAITRARFDEKALVEVGIGCESCHGGSAEHVRKVSLSPAYEPRAAFLRVRLPRGEAKPEPAKQQRINRLCARCHQVLFTKYQWTWEGSTRTRQPGGSNINSGEARDFLLGGCASQMSCVACHDPHASDGQTRMRALEGAAGDAICQRCHPAYVGDAAVRAHTKHEPGGPGSRCLACHMPRKNMSLENRLTRYHRIGSPTDRARVEGDRPLECALCHADKTVTQLLGDIERLYGKHYDRAPLQRLYGDLDANIAEATLKRGKPHEQAVALSMIGERRVLASAPLVAEQLTHAIPIVRYYALGALESILGKPVTLDLFVANAKITAAATELLRSVGLASRPGTGKQTAPTAGDEQD